MKNLLITRTLRVKRLKIATLFFALIASECVMCEWNWPLRAYINDSDGEYTNIRNAPSGKVILQLPTGRVYLINLSDFQKGWWKIDGLVLINYNSHKCRILDPYFMCKFRNQRGWHYFICVVKRTKRRFFSRWKLSCGDTAFHS